MQDRKRKIPHLPLSLSLCVCVLWSLLLPHTAPAKTEELTFTNSLKACVESITFIEKEGQV